MTYSVAALYCFAPIEDVPSVREDLRAACAARGVLGTLILAPEGINGTIACEDHDGLVAVVDHIRAWPGMDGMELKYSSASEPPFRKLKVKHKKEIVTIRNDLANPNAVVGTYVMPEDWNDLIADPEMIVIDTRNDYEFAEGTFKGALNPSTKSFGQFPDFVEKHLNPEIHKKVAMFCTGGIRCEKASSFMKAKGFENVYHLKGGILKYLETVPADQSTWEGNCYVFDRREVLGHGLKEEEASLPWGREKRIEG